MQIPTISKEEYRSYFIKTEIGNSFVPGSPPCVFMKCKSDQFEDCMDNEKDCSAFRNFTGTGKPYLTHIMKDIRPFDKLDNTINDKKINCEKDSVCHTPHKSPLCRECDNFSNLGAYRKKVRNRWQTKHWKPKIS